MESFLEGVLKWEVGAEPWEQHWVREDFLEEDLVGTRSWAQPAHCRCRGRSSWGTCSQTGGSCGRKQGRCSTHPVPGPPTARSW